MAANPTYGQKNASPVSGNPLLNIVGNDEAAWQARSRIVLLPTAAPSIMGLFGFFIATLMVGAWQAGWLGSATSPFIFWPLALFAGGLCQIVAAIGCLRARDGVALAVHAVWGSFWLGWSVFQLLVETHVATPIALGAINPSLGIWFIGLAAVTMSAMLASLAKSAGNFLVLSTLTAGAALTASGFWAGSLGTLRAGGWLFVVAAAAAWYLASAMMMEHAFGRTILPVGKYSRAANVPGETPSHPIQYPEGMPGSKVGQ